MKCIVSDFDGTLYDDNISENIVLVKKFVNKNNIFIIATGRTFQSIKNAIKDYNVPYEYLITSDGAAIYDKNDNIIYQKYLDDKLKYDVIKFILNKRKLIHIKFDNNNRITDDLTYVSRILISGQLNEKEELCKELNDSFTQIYSYNSENWLDITYKKYNKLEAIKYLQSKNKIDEIYTIGNDQNDYKMIEYYDGYLVKSSDSKYKMVDNFREFIKKISN